MPIIDLALHAGDTDTKKLFLGINLFICYVIEFNDFENNAGVGLPFICSVAIFAVAIIIILCLLYYAWSREKG